MKYLERIKKLSLTGAKNLINSKNKASFNI